MRCPVDDTVLQMTDRQGIEIDYCPQCRGVWLDRGELDKLVDRAAAAVAPPARPDPPVYPPRERDHDRDYDHSRSRDSGYYKKRKKESFLGELFDF